MSASERFFLFVGRGDADAATSHLKASGISYRRKMLESKPENWEVIAGHLEDDGLVGVIVKLTASTYELLVGDAYKQTSDRICLALAKVPHLLLVHEAVLTGETRSDEGDDDGDGSFFSAGFFTPPKRETREAVDALIERHGLRVVPYRTNAELDVLATAFISDHERNLLFRVYVPTSRLWSAEGDRVLSMFRDWLTRVKGYRVREDGYETKAGRVYEFYGDETLDEATLSEEFNEFSRFVEACITSTADAKSLIGVRPDIEEVVTRFAKEGRRLAIDLKHERERRVLSLRHQLEAELTDLPIDQLQDVAALVDATIPSATGLQATGPMVALGERPPSIAVPQVTINQQIIRHVQGSVVQNIEGTINLKPEALELLELISAHAGDRSSELATAVHELEDDDARRTDRLAARQALKGFLYKVGSKLGDASIKVLQAYVEHRLGV